MLDTKIILYSLFLFFSLCVCVCVSFFVFLFCFSTFCCFIYIYIIYLYIYIYIYTNLSNLSLSLSLSLYIYIYIYIKVVCKFILLLIWKVLKQNKNLEIKKNKIMARKKTVKRCIQKKICCCWKIHYNFKELSLQMHDFNIKNCLYW